MDRLSIAGWVGAGLVLLLLVVLHLMAVRVPVIGKWEAPPAVYLDPEASVSATQVSAAMARMRELGHVFNDGGPIESQSTGHRLGAITIIRRDAPWGDDHSGRTELRQAADGTIKSALVMLPGDIEREDLVLTHELAHALGHGHTSTALPGPFIAQKTGHLMHPSTEGIGWDTTGMKQD